MEPTAKVSVWIKAPPERVYRYVGDPATHGTWANPKAKLQFSDDGGALRTNQTFLGKPMAADIVVTRAEEPRRFEFEARQADGTFKHSFVLRPENGGTTVERTVVFPEAKGFKALMLKGVIVPGPFSADARKTLKRLKALAEQI
jgi:uncharacterized protein YndB with AHSA1/START domain